MKRCSLNLQLIVGALVHPCFDYSSPVCLEKLWCRTSERYRNMNLEQPSIANDSLAWDIETLQGEIIRTPIFCSIKV